jgi:hypothetical protein
MDNLRRLDGIITTRASNGAFESHVTLHICACGVAARFCSGAIPALFLEFGMHGFGASGVQMGELVSLPATRMSRLPLH